METMSSPPFIEPESLGLDTDQIRNEALPLTGLIMLFAGLALIPFLLALLLGGGLAALFTVIAQFVLAVGTGVVLMYVIARGIQLAD
jgi:predicted membrane-bound spermidine synthase